MSSVCSVAIRLSPRTRRQSRHQALFFSLPRLRAAARLWGLDCRPKSNYFVRIEAFVRLFFKDFSGDLLDLRHSCRAADHPLLAGRCEQIRQQGGNPFQDYQLPCAILKFKQGFGRLIRSKTDTGIVVVLDSRIITKPYGRQFLAAIPKCKTEIITGTG